MDGSLPTAILERLTALYPKSIDLSLDRVRRLLADLGSPQDRLPPVIHVAGTNGKGSTVATMRAILEAAGYRVHVYTSPHLVRFNERIRLAGRLIEDGPLAALLAEVERVNAGRPITFFEVTTAAAFLAFARTPADIVLLETGLGGRLDATNLVARPAACALTPVSIDHVDFLGDTVEKIAGEKAGILKPGVIAALGPQPIEAQRAFERAAEAVGATLFRHGSDWIAVPTAGGGFRYAGRRTLALPPPSLPGVHQIDNAGLAIGVLENLDGFAIEEAHIRAGLASVEWPARLQRLMQGPLVELLPAGIELYLDGGHNESAGAALAEWARSAPGPVDLVFGMRANKAADRFFAHVAPRVRRLRAVAIDGDPLSLPPDAVAELARTAGIDAAPARSVDAAVADLAARSHGGPPPPARILICGSLYLAGHILAENG
jgi:dihydrofolate synthase/folylpolyglutamate synthase